MEGDRRGDPRAARRLRRRRHVGRDRRARERHRGQLGRAGGLAGGGHAGSPPRLRAPVGQTPPRDRSRRARRDPARAARARPRGGAGGARGAALGPALARPARARLRGRLRRARRRARTRARSPPGTAGLHLALRAIGVAEGDEVVTSPFSFVASANAVLYERARPVFADIDPVTLNLDPAAAAAAITERTAALLPVHIFGYPADVAGARGASGCRSSRTPARRSAPSTPTGRPVGGRGHPAVVRLLRQQAAHHGRGRDGHHGRRRRTRCASTPSATRAAPRTWAGSTTTGSASTTGSTDIACALGLAQLERLDEMLAGRARVAASTARRSRRWSPSRARAAVRGRRRRRAAAGSSSSSSSRTASTATTTMVALRERGVQSKPYLPAIHLMSFYRERFGHRAGEFPVCRGRRRALAGAAVLPGDDRGSGRAGGRGARARAQPAASLK